MDDVNSDHRIGSEEENGLWQKVLDGDDEAREQLILIYRPLVFWIAKKFRVESSSHPDLVQEGMMALIKAVDSFDFRRGNRFTTYSYYRIRGQMINFLQRREAKAPLPVDLLDYDVPDPFSPDLLDSLLDVRDGLASLPERENRIVSELVMEGKSAKEIASAESLDVSHVYRLRKKALRWLKGWLSADHATTEAN